MIIAIVRVFLVFIVSVSICVFGIVYCLLCFRKSYHVSVLGYLFGCMAPIFGIKVEIRNVLGSNTSKACVYVANHQNNYDMVTVSYIVQPNTITVGKKNLLWIPLFGQLYWLSGNILVDRSRSMHRTRNILNKIIKTIKIHNISVWMFPEGTRNHGRGLLPFKSGAFYAAIASKSAIVPICVSNLSGNRIKLTRWCNGLVIIEVMPPIETDQCSLHQVRRIAAYCHKIMQLKIELLNKEVELRESN